MSTSLQQSPVNGASRGSLNSTARLERRGLSFIRRFSQAGRSPFDCLKWERREALITDELGQVFFRQENVEVPESWSQMATNVVASKYFRGALGSAQREHSVRQLISRVAETIAQWGRKDGYFVNDSQAQVFEDELKALLVEQYGSFNSPVWFNVGVESKPQCSACFILSVEDNMESLLELQRTEAMLFKYGSGAGSNLSNIRSAKELLSGGGVPSGPVSFMRGYDAWAGTIKSGGKTRRAAKMQILNADHPDILQFVQAKRLEEQRAWALIEQGYDGGFNVIGGAYDSVFFQNANLSVRVTDEFMEAVLRGENYPLHARTDGRVVDHVDARQLLREIAEGTWVCGDPGLQFDTTINEWHTCPQSGRINASNPCSEYMHLDDSACNLASINLLKFLTADGQFDIEGFTHAVDIFITAQDIIVDNASYPTVKIGENARTFRQLGLGFANLGALLMCSGAAYDSNEGRGLAGALMALLCGEAYCMSARLAEEMGPFAAYEENARDMLRVVRKHRAAAEKLPHQFALSSLTDAARRVWEEAHSLGSRAGFRNSQTTVLAPTGTIAFLMDCDTTGVEPDIALVKYKKLVGGGVLKMINRSVPRALQALGYSVEAAGEILRYIEEQDTIEGAPGISDNHLAVFDCAFRALNGRRYIHHMGHVKMMAAVQPFVSGAISKTVNLPEHATVDDIFSTYVEAWKMGLKAIAIYRDGSKRSQPLSTKKADKQQGESLPAEPMIKRRYLPDERQAITHKFSIAGHEGYITVGLYEDGSPGEIFIVMAKEGSTLSGVMDAFATSISLALQYGVPLSALVKKFSHMRFEPSGFTSSKQIPFAKSIFDYIFRWLGSKFISTEEQKALGIMVSDGSRGAPADTGEQPVPGGELQTSLEKEPSNAVRAIGFAVKDGEMPVVKGSNTAAKSGSVSARLPYVSDDAPPCSTCGSSMMVRQGACYRCLNCGAQGGCG